MKTTSISVRAAGRSSLHGVELRTAEWREQHQICVPLQRQALVSLIHLWQSGQLDQVFISSYEFAIEGPESERFNQLEQLIKACDIEPRWLLEPPNGEHNGKHYLQFEDDDLTIPMCASSVGLWMPFNGEEYQEPPEPELRYSGSSSADQLWDTALDAWRAAFDQGNRAAHAMRRLSGARALTEAYDLEQAPWKVIDLIEAGLTRLELELAYAVAEGQFEDPSTTLQWNFGLKMNAVTSAEKFVLDVGLIVYLTREVTRMWVSQGQPQLAHPLLLLSADGDIQLLDHKMD